MASTMSASSFLPGMPSASTVSTQLRGGVMSGAYVLHHILAIAVMPAAFLVMVFGFGGLLLNPDNAYTTWNWWRLFGATFIAFVPPFVEYWLGQERKVAMTTNAGVGNVSYNRAQINLVFAAYMVMLVVLGAWLTLLTIWLGIEDFANCASSAICSGTSASTTPTTGAIMTIVGMGVLSICCWILLLGGLYVHAAARDAYNARLSVYFPLADQIGSQVDDHAAYHAMFDPRRKSLGDHVHAMFVGNARDVFGVDTAPVLVERVPHSMRHANGLSL